MLGRALRRARRDQRRTLADVAAAATVSLPYLSELERGRKEASSEVLAAICDALHIELSDLLAEAGRTLAAERVLAAERARAAERRLAAERGPAADRLIRAPVAPVVPLDAVRGPRVEQRVAGPGPAQCRLAA
jgi:transcriptional regulator with XRE-family HTH domain